MLYRQFVDRLILKTCSYTPEYIDYYNYKLYKLMITVEEIFSEEYKYLSLRY